MKLALTIFAACAVLAGAARAEAAPPEPAGYRMENFRAPVPSSLAGGRVIDTEQAQKLWQDKAAAFVDVLPRPPKPANLPPDTVWRDKPRRDIPGSLWLPDTGYGLLPEAMQAYFERGLVRASAGDKTRALAFYCLRDCWMSWNAAKRAISLGYANVIWYPDGTDGWEDAGFPLEDRAAEPRD
jgi:PQQ-dependent catabolism-associated CXXCW motif protein